MKRFDAAALDTRKAAEQGFEFELLDLEGEKTGIFIKVIGADCDEYRKAERQMQVRNMESYQKTKKLGRAFGQTEEQRLDLMVLATKGWRTVVAVEPGAEKSEPVVDLGGKVLEFNEQNVRSFYAVPAVLEQVAEAVHNRANFSPVSAKTS